MAKLKSNEALCPACAEVIKAAASKCKHCGHELTQSELAARAEAKARSKRSSALGCGLLILLVIGLAAIGSSGKDDPKGAADAKQAAVDHKKGLDCLSKWDGSNSGMVQTVKNSLRDPDSFEHVDTRLAPPKKDGKVGIMMRYRARNGFGGMNVGYALGTLDPNSCDVSNVRTDG